MSYTQSASVVTQLKCEYKVNPIGIDINKPRVSWKILSPERSVMQSAYQIRAAASAESLTAGKELLWDSGKVKSEQSIHVVYAGPELASRQRVYWQVRIWDNKGYQSEWSQTSFWEMGLLHSKDWQSQWIEPNLVEDPSASNPCPILRKEFSIKKDLKSARTYITSHGLYQMEINGQLVSDELFTPGWTSYNHRLQYQTYDITSLLKKENNCVGVTLGDGWYRGYLRWDHLRIRNFYGNKLALLTQIELIYNDGTTEIITTDQTWKASIGPILKSDIYNGEVYDARLEKPGWTKPDYNDFGWKNVDVKNYSKDILIASAGVPVKRVEYIKPIKILKTKDNKAILDMGQNMVGWLRFNVKEFSGNHIKLQYAEVLDANGNFYTKNLRLAKQTDEYFLNGNANQTFEPHFTFHGFRYVEIEGWQGEPSTNDFMGIVIHSDVMPTGQFSCSDPNINKLQHNIQWGQKGNFVDVPTDCPQRDERLGWTGDAQVFAPTACFNADVAAFYTKWLRDLTADQKQNGAVPHVIPNVLDVNNSDKNSASAGWADAAVIVPWTVYLCYGDTCILEKQYDSMKSWVDYMAKQADPDLLWKKDYTHGDWLAYTTTRSDYPGATTDKDLICQAYFARSTDILCRVAKILGKANDVQKYADLLGKIKKVFQAEFVTPRGRLASNTQTAYSLVLAFDLLPDELRENAAKRLNKDVNDFKHITTGFLGTPLICRVLSDYGYEDTAYMLLNRKEYPSWLYPVSKGATTIWERWDGIKADGSFQDSGNNSFNHYAYGAIGDWLYSVVAGIKIDENHPGYKEIIIEPHPGGGLTHAEARLESMYGSIESNWQLNDKAFILKVEIPTNTTALVTLPSAMLSHITESGKALEQTDGILAMHQQQNDVVVKLGSGRYVFKSEIRKDFYAK
jgi:alpha-L-rhamnosidase